jgi:hypothetical protein
MTARFTPSRPAPARAASEHSCSRARAGPSLPCAEHVRLRLVCCRNKLRCTVLCLRARPASRDRASVDCAGTRTAWVAARAAWSWRSRARCPGRLGTDGKHRQLLLEIGPVARRALQFGTLADEHLEVMIALRAVIFVERHTSTSPGPPGWNSVTCGRCERWRRNRPVRLG